MKPVFESFPISNQEYQALENEFDKLAHFQSWQLFKKNTKNNHTDDLEDIIQEIRVSIIRAASYYKRQVYIEKCFDVLDAHIQDDFIRKLLDELKLLWSNRTRHGANKVIFGEPQEAILDHMVQCLVPKEKQPERNASLVSDMNFQKYCKNVSWNCQKTLGKKITREKPIRTGLVSLSEYDYLSTVF